MPEVTNPEIEAKLTDLDALFARMAKEMIDPLKANTAQVEELKRRIDENEATLKAMAKTARERDFVGITKTGDPAKDFSLSRGLAGYTNKWAPIGEHKKFPEREIVEAAAEIRLKTAQAAGFDHLGGFVIPGELSAEIIEELAAESIAITLGARVIQPTSTPYMLPRIAVAPTASQVDENEAVGTTNIEYDRLMLTPHEFGELIEVSNRMLMFADPAFDADLRRLIAESMARKADAYVLKGSGGSGEPVGILNTSGIGSSAVPTAYGAIDAVQTVTRALDTLIGKVEDANALKGRLGFAMHPQGKRKFMSTIMTSGAPLFQAPSFVNAAPGGNSMMVPGSMYGYPYKTTTQLAGSTTAELLFGNWADVLVPMWGGIVIATSEHVNFAKRQTVYRATSMMDVGLRHVESFATWSNAWDVSSA